MISITSVTKRMGLSLLSLSLLCGSWIVPVPKTFAAEQGQEGSIFEPINVIENVQKQDADTRVKIIVEMEDEPLISYQTRQGLSSAEDFWQSNETKSLDKQLAAKRVQVEKKLLRSGMDITVEREYSTVLNGFSIEADLDDLENIQNTEGIKNAFVVRFHKLIEPVEYQPYLVGSVPSIGGDIAGDELGYTGKGTVVAILDTGLDMEHDAFKGVNGAKYVKEDIAQILSSNRLTIGKLSASAVYKNEKVPYAFDYADLDTNVSGGSRHGTHVAGIVGANSGGVIKGVAPDAQLIIMKVFGDKSGGAYDDDILAALDDSIKLGADTINMSLGSAGGFTTDADKTMKRVYERVGDAGINLMCAAGNDYSATRNNTVGNNLPRALEPDNGIVASPSTYTAAVSVASTNNMETTSIYFTVGTHKIRYNDPAQAKNKQLASLEGTYDFVDCGVGSKEDFASIDVRGKIALIQRAGEENGKVLTFVQKESNARAAGAVAAIVYDNVLGELVSMATDNKIPCVFISKSDGEKINGSAQKQLTVSTDFIDRFKDTYSGKMSGFSSWGVTSDLKLKPEISAPGGDIYSSLPNDLYGNMSGTSMASPHMAGAAVVMDQYIREEQNGLVMTQTQRTELANALMMSTAAPIRDAQGNFYSPRKQGAGLVQLQRAVTSGAYLTSNVGGRPKAELGYSLNGNYSFAFNAVSIADNSIKYQVEVSVLTEEVVHEKGVDYMAQAARVLTSEEVTVTKPDMIELTAGSTEKISIDISLTEKGRTNLEETFPNGIYIEGFVTLTPVNGDSIPLSLPFMGFYGDWAALPMFDSTIYDDREASLYEMRLGQFRNSDNGGYMLGTNLYVKDADEYNAEKIAIQGKDKTKHVTAVTSLLRNADKLTFSVDASDGDTVYSESLIQIGKTFYHDDAFYTPMAHKGWTPYDTWGSPLDDGNYTYTVTGENNGKKQSVSFPIVIDTVKPEIVSSIIEGNKWKVTVRDNHYVQAICPTVSGNTPLIPWIEPDVASANTAVEVVFDLSDSEFNGLSQGKIAMIDYAGNQYLSDYYSFSDAQIIYPSSILASINAPENITEGAMLPYTFSLEKMTRVATVSLSFEKDEGMVYVDASGKNGFTPLGVKWSDENQGTIALSYLKDGAGGSVTKEALTDIAQLTFSTAMENSNCRLRFTGITVSGYDANGNAVYLTTEISRNSAQIRIVGSPKCDLNGDGVVDLLDITYCQKFYRSDAKAGNWEKARVCDLDSNGIVDIQDMIIILLAM